MKRSWITLLRKRAQLRIKISFIRLRSCKRQVNSMKRWIYWSRDCVHSSTTWVRSKVTRSMMTMIQSSLSQLVSSTSFNSEAFATSNQVSPQARILSFKEVETIISSSRPHLVPIRSMDQAMSMFSRNRCRTQTLGKISISKVASILTATVRWTNSHLDP